VFALFSFILGLVLSASTLPNGIRLIELPARGDSVEIITGYDEQGLTDLASIAAARSAIFKAFATGGDIQVLNQQDRSALQFTIPQWAFPALADQQLANLLRELPQGTGDPPTATDFRSKVEEEIRLALLGIQGPALPYATADAFVAMSAPTPNGLRDALASIPKRAGSNRLDDQVSRIAAERTLRFKSDLPTGAVIFAVPVPGVYYREWYMVLLIDRVIHRILPMPMQTTLPLSLHPYYYRLELSLQAGQFPEPAEERLLQELQRLQLAAVDPQQLLAARQEALAYLDSNEVREWFAGRGIPDRLEEGIQWVQAITSDDFRAAARDLLSMNRVIVTWPPKLKQTTVESESLDAAPQPSPTGRGSGEAAGEGAVVQPFPFPPHKDPPQNVDVPQRLSSGVSLVASNVNAVFVSGISWTKYDHEPDADTVKSFEKYPAERILVLAPARSIDHARELWSSFKGVPTREAAVPKGPVSSGDLPAIYVLKTILDLKVIQAGWWRDVELRIDAGQGSSLQIHAADAKRERILQWIKDIAAHASSDKEYAWMREVAVHRFDDVRADLQALTWERDPQGTIQDIETVVPKFVQDVAQIYF
jgi:hypothetical protein